jgi:Fatty acid hydroxylase superfamily
MTKDGRFEVRADLMSRVPRWYSPTLHLLAPALAGLAAIAWSLSRIEGIRAWELGLVPLFLVASNALEWHAHRDLLHRRTWPLEELYVRHTPQHHAVFVSEDMYIREWREVKLVLLPAWGVLAIVVSGLPIALLFALAGLPNVARLWVATIVGYVLLYEWLHLAYHLPAEGPIGRLRVTRWLRRHHQRHHAPQLMQRWNFNVTIPLWDHVRGTVWRPEEVPSPAVQRRV